MKRIAVAALLFFAAGSLPLNAQLLNKIKEKVKETAEQKAEDKAANATGKAVDKADTAVSSTVTKTVFKSKKRTDNAAPTSAGNKTDNAPATNTQGAPEGGANASMTAYSKYDFVPGDQIIFQDALKDEKEGEFPSQFTASGGQGQTFLFNGEMMFQTLADNTIVSPRIKGSNYLPDQYTIEFDAYVEGSGDEVVVKLNGIGEELTLYSNNAVFGNYTGAVPTEVSDQWYPDAKNYAWRHYAIAVNKTLMKAYIDQFRVLNVPNIEGKATSVSFAFTCSSGAETDCKNMFLKNFRIAAGGIDIYKKVESEGRIVTHGITFDLDKSTIKPESMGTINQLFELLKSSPAVKFEIDGHTDNSGTAAHNLSLSQQRADAVKDKLVSMGIDPARLTTKGFGDTKPLSENTSPEGRANNRRVELVKQ